MSEPETTDPRTAALEVVYAAIERTASQVPVDDPDSHHGRDLSALAQLVSVLRAPDA